MHRKIFILKTAEVAPLSRANDRQIVSNCRPIFVICNLAKILEEVIYRKLYKLGTRFDTFRS